MVVRYIAGRDFETPTGECIQFEEKGEALVAIEGSRKRARHLLGGYCQVHKDDKRLHNTLNDAINAEVKELKRQIEPTLQRIRTYLAMQTK